MVKGADISLKVAISVVIKYMRLLMVMPMRQLLARNGPYISLRLLCVESGPQ